MRGFGRKVTAILFLGLAPGFALAAPAPPSKSGHIRLGGVHAHLYYESLGQIDERDLVVDKMGLRNTIIGEGDAKAPSNTTMVVVDVVGPSFPSGTKGTISVTAKNGKRLLRREAVQLESFFSEGTKLSIPFIVVGTGCGTLKIDVDLTINGTTDRAAQTVEFPCGE